jgi:hypothetical protein
MTDGTGKPGNGPADSEKAPELDELARRLLDLWQDQLTAVAANPDLAAQAARLMAAMPLPGMWLNQLGQMGTGQMGGQMGGLSGDDLTKAWTKMTQDWMAQDWWKGEAGASATRAGAAGATPKEPSGHGSSPAGAKAAAAASQPRGSDLDELSHRLAGIEQRLAQLAEQQPKRKPATKPKASAAKPRRTGAKDGPGGSGGADGGAAG